MEIIIEDTPQGGIAIYDGEQRVIARCSNYATRDQKKAVSRTGHDKLEIDFCRAVSIETIVAVLEGVRNHEPDKDWIE